MSNSTTPDPETQNHHQVTTKLQLAHHQPAEALHKEAVLWRIRYHKCIRKVKGTFETLANRTTNEKWSEPMDVFTSP
ncbi:hypothetical protein HanIR_Chr06g0276581 [Helianthus annuus]|nr:hypothetical protein HanIR_Chr06g0276581 [Helianthus annuus]